MDAFFVSVELLERPELRGKPVVAGGPANSRGVVSAASYEARRFGIFSATPAERARRLCPDAIFIPPDFESYRARSREVMAVLRANVERVEVVGLDEAYLDLSGFDRHRAARRLKEAVREMTGLTCSIGLGPSKLVAKVASDAEKPDGFVALTREGARERFAAASPGLIPGIGPRTVARLAEHDVELARPASRDPGGAARGVVRSAPGAPPRAARALRGRAARARALAHGQVGACGDHLPARPPRPGGCSSRAGAPERGSCAPRSPVRAAAAGPSGSRSGSTISRPTPGRAPCPRRSAIWTPSGRWPSTC